MDRPFNFMEALLTLVPADATPHATGARYSTKVFCTLPNACRPPVHPFMLWQVGTLVHKCHRLVVITHWNALACFGGHIGESLILQYNRHQRAISIKVAHLLSSVCKVGRWKGKEAPRTTSSHVMRGGRTTGGGALISHRTSLDLYSLQPLPQSCYVIGTRQ